MRLTVEEQLLSHVLVMMSIQNVSQYTLSYRQTKFAMRALNANVDHPTHQLLPANFRFGELHRYEGATGQP